MVTASRWFMICSVSSVSARPPQPTEMHSFRKFPTCSSRGSALVFEGSEHDISVHKAELGVAECPGQSADDVEAKLLPEPDRRFIGGDDEVKLHGAEAESAGLAEA